MSRTFGRTIVRGGQKGYGWGRLDAFRTAVLRPRFSNGPIRTQERGHVRPGRKGGTRSRAGGTQRRFVRDGEVPSLRRGALEAEFLLGPGKRHVSVPSSEELPASKTVLFPERQRSIRSMDRSSPSATWHVLDRSFATRFRTCGGESFWFVADPTLLASDGQERRGVVAIPSMQCCDPVDRTIVTMPVSWSHLHRGSQSGLPSARSACHVSILDWYVPRLQSHDWTDSS